uniref:Retrovirus-related Pol polyprotein from transposon TNT 1-94 n=1 Tax=Tanacetum cinerariifolium TaxID=118510 RepID=A0A699H1C5_TANCI|nr:hypothetical protein [Tanacetum cinerariifolium]
MASINTPLPHVVKGVGYHTRCLDNRLGHINKARLQVLEKQDVLGKNSLGSDRLCSFRLLGLSQVESFGGKRYFLSIIDDYSMRVEVELKGLNTHTLDEDQTDNEDGNDEDARDQETDQTPNLTDYQLDLCTRVHNGKSVKIPLDGHFKLSFKDCPIRDCDVERMSLVHGTDHGNHVDITSYVDSDYAKDPDKASVYGPYGFCEGSYLAKGTLGKVER